MVVEALVGSSLAGSTRPNIGYIPIASTARTRLRKWNSPSEAANSPSQGSVAISTQLVEFRREPRRARSAIAASRALAKGLASNPACLLATRRRGRKRTRAANRTREAREYSQQGKPIGRRKRTRSQVVSLLRRRRLSAVAPRTDGSRVTFPCECIETARGQSGGESSSPVVERLTNKGLTTAVECYLRSSLCRFAAFVLPPSKKPFPCRRRPASTLRVTFGVRPIPHGSRTAFGGTLPSRVLVAGATFPPIWRGLVYRPKRVFEIHVETHAVPCEVGVRPLAQ
eukprot:9231892-Pyramimonas_sp.AAC.1